MINRFATLLLVTTIFLSGCGTPTATQSAPLVTGTPATTTALKTWAATLTLVSPSAAQVGTLKLTSSSKFEVRWNLPNETVDHFEMSANDGKEIVTQSVKGTEKTGKLTMLKADTKYIVTLKACLDAKCEKFLASDKAPEGKTAQEYWQVQGTGNSFKTATHIVEDGNTKPYAVVYGDWAGKDLAGKTQVYYDPIGRDEKGVKIATVNGTDLFSLTGVKGFGLISYCIPQPNSPSQPTTPGSGPPSPAPPQRINCEGTSSAARVHTFQVVPMTNGIVRIFFEGEGTDGKTRIMSLDSKDGYVGRDFNAGSATVCSKAADYAKGGGCEPTVWVGIDGDPVFGNPKVSAARQFKIGYPTLTDGRWDGTLGTFMFITIDLPQTCTQYRMVAGYAVWNGKEWRLQYDSNGCPKRFEAVQAPMPLHMGEGRYKMYFNNSTATFGTPGGAPPAAGVNSLDNKPMKMIFGDSALSGDPKVVEFEDWETSTQARDINYVWPDGTPLSLADESHLDDFVIFYPDPKNPDRQLMYSNMATGDPAAPGNAPPFIGGLVLLNP